MESVQSIKEIGKPIVVRYSSDINWKMDRSHFHDMYEIYYSQTDNVDIFVNDIVYQVLKGAVLVFNTTDIHRTISSDNAPYNRHVIHFTPDCMKDLCTMETDLLDCFVNRGPQFSHKLQLEPQDMEQFAALMEKAKRFFQMTQYGQDVSLRITLAEILLFINKRYQNNVRSVAPKSKKEFETVYPILEYIQSNISGDLCLDSLSERFYINKYYLIGLFKKATGFTVGEYIIQRRIMKACELLKTGMPVQQAGETAGFNDNSHFIRTFKGHVGLPPKRYALQFSRAVRPSQQE